MKGKVYLVGAGPGAPGLLTLRGKQCLERADVVVYDYLANPRLLDHAPATAERILVGKHGGGQRVEQSTINAMLVTHATAGKTVVRLKGGDPFVFGRGGEEALVLHDAGIEFEVVPGVSAAIAVPAYAGIPLTHRVLASNLVVSTGYEDSSKDEPSVRWQELARAGSTIVLLMTTRQLRGNFEKLIAGGLDPTTPAAVIEWGTRAAQRTLAGTAANLADLAEAANIAPPAIAVIGEVVRLREALQWFERKPLFGRRIVITRPRGQAASFAEALEELGAEIVPASAVRIVAEADTTRLDEAIAHPERYDWLFFTSANGVRIFIDRMRELGADIRRWNDVRIAAIGPQTARELARLCVQVDLVPGEYRAEGLLAALADESMQGQRILLPRAANAREILPEQLGQLGALVEEVVTYRAEPCLEEIDTVADLAQRGQIDLVTFTSSSTVHAFARALGPKIDLTALPVGCIGPVTAATATEYGMTTIVQPAKFDIPSFVEAIASYFGAHRLPPQGENDGLP